VNPGRYTVEPGDTLGSIARQFGVTMADLADWNDLSDPDLLRPGWALLVKPPSSAPVSAASSPSAASSSPGPGQVYIVQEGDTLWRIADRFGVDPNALARANGLGPDDIIRVGQSLTVSTGQWYTVQPGDTLRSIADQYGTSVAALLQLNDFDDPDHLAIGRQLRVR
jgi:LysM repeat protein